LKAYQSFVLILTTLQVFLLAASAEIKGYLEAKMDKNSTVALQLNYDNNVKSMRSSKLQFVSGFARRGLGRAQRLSQSEEVSV